MNENYKGYKIVKVFNARIMYAVILNGEKLKVCKTKSQAKAFIDTL